MAGNYAAEHASALADVQAANPTALVFTRNMPGTFQPATGAFFDETTNRFYDPRGIDTPGVTTITAYAIGVDPNTATYAALGLSQSAAPSLFVVTAAYGDTVLPGDTTVWAGQPVTVVSVDAVAPDGVTICATVVAQR